MQERETKIHESKSLMLGREKRLAVKGNMYIGKENWDPGKENSDIWVANGIQGKVNWDTGEDRIQ
jgi:hypothetical protein